MRCRRSCGRAEGPATRRARTDALGTLVGFAVTSTAPSPQPSPARGEGVTALPAAFNLLGHARAANETNPPLSDIARVIADAFQRALGAYRRVGFSPPKA